MKKLFVGLLTLTMCFALASCSSDNQESSGDTKSTETQISSEDTESTGEQISIVGQVAADIEDGESTLSIQVQNDDGRWVIYHCDMKDEFLDEAKEFKLTDVAKVKGYVLSKSDLGQENTAIIVNLYDCEIVE